MKRSQTEGILPHRAILSFNLIKVDGVVGRKRGNKYNLTLDAYNRKSWQIRKSKNVTQIVL